MDECKQQNHLAMAIAYDASTVHQVLTIGTKEEILEILKDEIDLNCTSGNGDTMLHSVFRNDRLMERDIVEILNVFLTQLNANPNIRNNYEETVLHLAIKKRMKSTVDLLLKFEADFNVVDEKGNSIAHFFVENEYKKCVVKKYRYFNDPIEYSEKIENDVVSFLHFLISKDVDFDRQNNEGKSALDLAFEYQLSYLLPTILDSSIAIMADHKYGCKMISKAIRENMSTSLIQTLISFYLKYCDDRNLATTLFYELLGTCKLWCHSEKDYYLTVLRDLRTMGVNINNETLQTKLEFTAAEAENSRLVEFLKESLVHFTVEPRNEKNVLHMIAEQRYYEGPISELCELICNLLVSDNCQVDSMDEQGKTALQVAAGHGHVKMVEVLINLGASVNCRDQHMDSPLHEALVNKVSAEVAELLIKNGADVTATDYKGETPLHLAVYNKYIVELLLAHGASVNCKNKQQSTPLLEALVINAPAEVVDLLITNGADVTVTDSRGETPLHLAVYNKHVVQLLLAHGGSVNCKNEHKETPLHRAAMIDTGDQVVDLLLSNGADANVKDRRGDTPLYLAIAKNNVKIVRSLLRHNAFVNCKNDYDQTPLSRAVINEDAEEIVELLLASGAEVNAKDYKNDTPLQLVVSNSFGYNNLSNARLLIQYGADVNCKDNNQQTPLHRAVELYETVEMFELLLRNGADVNARDSDGNRPLHMIFKRWSGDNYLRILDMLLKNGAYVNARNNAGESALYSAISFKNRFAIQDLLKYGADLNDPDVKKFVCYAYTMTDLIDLQEHLVKLKAANLSLDEEYITYINNITEEEFYNKCLEEIEILTCFFIDKNKSLLDFLQMNPKRRSVYLKHGEMQRLVQCPYSLHNQFPKYADIILASYHEAVTKKLLLQLAEDALCELIQPPLPRCVAVQILACLNDADMINIIDAKNM